MTFLKQPINDAVIIGSGGREHAIALGIKPFFNHVYVLPGNPGMASDVEIINIGMTRVEKMIQFLNTLNNPLIVIGPEIPLIDGLADTLRNGGFSVFGPGRDGARLEGSKTHSKTFMKKHGIPTADFFICNTLEECQRAIQSFTAPFVVKADGVAGGKGVFILDNPADSIDACEQLLNGSLGNAGKTIVVERALSGWELSVFVLTDGRRHITLPTVQDHKRAYENDQGPNTGGMGAYSPVEKATPDLMKIIENRVIVPTVSGLKSDGVDYKGILYIGLMIDAENIPTVLEYNIRFGDPEAQVLFPAVSCDWGKLLGACAGGTLNTLKKNDFSVSPTVTVVAASGGYPGTYDTGYEITGIDEASRLPNTRVYSAGIDMKNGVPVTNGGRVLAVTSTGRTLKTAVQSAYAGMDKIYFKNIHSRKDIAG